MRVFPFENNLFRFMISFVAFIVMFASLFLNSEKESCYFSCTQSGAHAALLQCIVYFDIMDTW